MAKLSKAVTSSDHLQGDPHAPLTLVEYGDYECPSCGVAARAVQQVQREFGDRLRFVFRNFPLPMHPHAEAAAETAEFANAQGKFWEVHDALFAHQKSLDTAGLRRIVEHAGLDAAAWEEALKAHKFRAHIRADMASGEASEVAGTPTFYINGEMFDDDYDAATLTAALEAAAPKH